MNFDRLVSRAERSERGSIDLSQQRVQRYRCALAITQNIALDGSIEMLGDWVDAQGQGGDDPSDLMAEMFHLRGESDRPFA